MKQKNVFISLILIIVILVVYSSSKILRKKVKDIVVGSNYSQAQYILGTSSSFAYVATTTNPQVTIPTGSEINYVNLLLTPAASSTTARIDFTVEYSDDNSTFYMSDVPSQNTVTSSDLSLIQHTTNASTTHIWIPGSVEPKRKSINIDNLGASYMRFTFFQGASGATVSNNYGLRINAVSVSNNY